MLTNDQTIIKRALLCFKERLSKDCKNIILCVKGLEDAFISALLNQPNCLIILRDNVVDPVMLTFRIVYFEYQTPLLVVYRTLSENMRDTILAATPEYN